MTLSIKDKRGLAKLEKISAIANVFATGIDRVHPKLRPVVFQITIRNIAVAHIVSRYTVMDDLLNQIIIFYYFGQQAVRKGSASLRTKKLRIFRHHMLDEMYLLKKMQIIHEIEPIPAKVGELLRKLNALRNAMTHSANPEERKEYRKTKKVAYSKRDIFTPQGLSQFEADWRASFKTLEARIPGLRAWTTRKARKVLKEHDIGPDSLQLMD